ncbi:hypothetical protein DENSPDRAFT_692398 [Dentipellis sp. KUC8613]|nr:hypothetical protein DENSPDRAFT_692398 [Dentipellis sp. KUC8613]
MTTPNPFPSSTVRSANASPVVVRRRPKEPPKGSLPGSTNASPVVVRRRPKERQKGSLPIFSRPGVYRPNPKRAVATTYPVKGKTRGKGAEGLLSCQSDGEDDTELLNRSKALRHELCEDAQGILDFWTDFTERASNFRQEMKDVREDADKDSERVQGIVREELGKVDKIKKRLAAMYEESDRKAIEYRQLSKAQDQQLHEAQVEYREARRANRRAGLR